MTDEELIAALREEDAYNERFYEPDPLHKLSADRIEALVKDRAAAITEAKQQMLNECLKLAMDYDYQYNEQTFESELIDALRALKGSV